MFKVDSSDIVNSFSNSYYELTSKCEEIKNIVNNLNIKVESETMLSNDREQLNETIGDFMEEFLGTISETSLPNKWVYDDNASLKKLHIDELLGYSHLDNPKEILEKAMFETYEDGLCARMAHFANITKHDIEDEGIAPVAQKLGINSNNIEHIKSRRTRKKNDFDKNEMIDTIKFANGTLNKYGYSNMEILDEAVANPNDEKNKKVYEKLQGLMKICGMSNYSNSNVKDFVKLIKCYKLNLKLTNLKEQGIRGCIYNIQVKNKLAKKALENDANADISDYNHEVLVGYYTESQDEFSINGGPATRLVIAGENDRFSMQFHESKYAMNKIKKDFDFKVEESLELKNKTNLRIPYSEEKDKSRIQYYKETVDNHILDKLKDIGYGVYNIIKKGYIGKLVALNKEKNEKLLEER